MAVAVESVQKGEEEFAEKGRNQIAYLKAEEFAEKGRNQIA